MNRVLVFIALASVLLSASACSKKPALPPSAAEAKNVLTILTSMVASYEKKQLSEFMDKVARDFPNRQALSQSIAGVFTKFDSIRFTVQYGKMLVVMSDKGNAKVTFTWDGEWQTGEKKLVKDGGRVSLVFDPKLKQLLSIDGKNPFLPQEGQGKQ